MGRNRERIAIYNKFYYQEHKEEILSHNKAYHQEHRAEKSAYYKARNKKLTQEVLGHYSNGTPICAHCGETDLVVLCIDHINNDGAEQRRKMGWGRGAGNVLYYWLVANKFPEGYQVLCYNCNIRKARLSQGAL